MPFISPPKIVSDALAASNRSREALRRKKCVEEVRPQLVSENMEIPLDFPDEKKDEEKRNEAKVQKYVDESGNLRVSRVRGMGVRMTRDLQWNLYLMKDREEVEKGFSKENVNEDNGMEISLSVNQDIEEGEDLTLFTALLTEGNRENKGENEDLNSGEDEGEIQWEDGEEENEEKEKEIVQLSGEAPEALGSDDEMLQVAIAKSLEKSQDVLTLVDQQLTQEGVNIMNKNEVESKEIGGITESLNVQEVDMFKEKGKEVEEKGRESGENWENGGGNKLERSGGKEEEVLREKVGEKEVLNGALSEDEEIEWEDEEIGEKSTEKYNLTAVENTNIPITVENNNSADVAQAKNATSALDVKVVVISERKSLEEVEFLKQIEIEGENKEGESFLVDQLNFEENLMGVS